jgi:hypothetical protein
MVHKYDGFLGELIKVWCLRFEGAIAIEREVVSSKSIGDDDDEVQILHNRIPPFYLVFKILKQSIQRKQVF